MTYSFHVATDSADENGARMSASGGASGGGVTVTSDGRCTCCPYGYHIDVDFMRYLEDMNSSTTLRKLKKIHRDKKKLRKSMEIYVKQQELQIANEGKTPPPDVVNQSERYLQVSVNASQRATLTGQCQRQ